MSFARLTVVLVLGCLLVPCGSKSATAAVTPEQRQQLAQISRDVREASGLIRRKKLDEGEKILDKAEEQLDALIAAGVSENERVVAAIKRSVAVVQRSLAVQRGENPQEMGGVSFSEDIAPIVEENCLGCHGGDDPKAGLDLSTFAGWEKGGTSRNPLGRVLLPRLMAAPPKRMPKDAPALAREEIQTIALWMRQGGKFDGKSKDDPIGEAAEDENEEPVMIAKPSGDETVSFTKDVAPFMVNICGQCHMGDDPESDFDITTFEGVMRGGASGQVIVPGDPEASRLWLMVSNKEQPRMPPGQRRITRENYDALTTWIREGAVFDGDDAKKSLREIVPSEGQMQAAKLAELSPEEFAAHRREVSDAHWARAFPKKTAKPVETPQFLVYGDVPAERTDQIVAWANAHVGTLRKAFGEKSDPLWKGKLAIYLVKDRFGYQEFAMAVNDRERVPDEVHGHAIVTSDLDEAYIVLEDIGDAPSTESPGMKAHLINLLTQAYLQQLADDLPEWLVQGTGLYLAAQSSPENPYFPALRQELAAALGGLTSPAQLFEEGTFSPTETPAVGVALVDFLIRLQGPATFSRFLQQLAGPADLPKAIQAVYRTTPAALATAFGRSVGGR